MTITASRIAIQVAAAGLFSLLGLAGAVLLMAPAAPAPFGPWQRVSQSLGGPQDFGAADFPKLTRRSGDALLCPADLCAATQKAAVPPVFTISAERLTAKLRKIALAEGRIEELPPVGADHLRFVQRSPILGLPDVIDMRIVPRSSGAATLALYGRPVLGLLDFGANSARLERWIEALGQ